MPLSSGIDYTLEQLEALYKDVDDAYLDEHGFRRDPEIPVALLKTHDALILTCSASLLFLINICTY